TLLSLLLSVAALNIARIHNVGIGAKNLPVVNMAESPVLVSLVFQRLERAGRIICVLGQARKIRVQYSDVEEVGNRRRILGSEIFGNRRGSKALTMQCHS